MPKTFIIALILSFCIFNSSSGQETLFKITQNHKIGYINAAGKVVIKPIYLNGDDFSEGLAAVRLNGYYGYIDTKGRFVIKPKYDMAGNFFNGLAIAYKDGQINFINNKGNKILSSDYNGIAFITKQKARIRTKGGHMGCINVPDKSIYIDTIYDFIEPFKYGVALVRINDTGKDIYSREGVREGVIDTNGKIIVPIGKYKNIENFSEGYARVETKEVNGEQSEDGIIDTKGHIVFTHPKENHCYISGDFKNGLAKVVRYKYWTKEGKRGIISDKTDYPGYINLEGKMVFSDTNYMHAEDFSNGRAFVSNQNREKILIDTKFKRIGTDTFEDVLNDTFHNGYAIVKKEDDWGIIDTNGEYIIKPEYDEITAIKNDYFIFLKENDSGIKHLWHS